MTELSLHSLCIPYRVANVMSFLVEICIGRGRYVSRPSDLSLIKVLQKQSMTLQEGLGWLADKKEWTTLKVLVAI